MIDWLIDRLVFCVCRLQVNSRSTLWFIKNLAAQLRLFDCVRNVFINKFHLTFRLVQLLHVVNIFQLIFINFSGWMSENICNRNVQMILDTIIVGGSTMQININQTFWKYVQYTRKSFSFKSGKVFEARSSFKVVSESTNKSKPLF